MVRSHFRKVLALCAASTLALCATTATAQQSGARHFDIPAQSLGEALVAFSAQADTPLIVPDALVKGKRAPAIQGQMRAAEALQRLLSGSGLKMSIGNGGTIMIVKDGELRRTAAALQETGRMTMAQAQRQEQNIASDVTDGVTAAEDRKDGAAQGGELRSDGAIAEILVEGRRTQNVDIRRTEDDPQPYVVFDRKEIEHSQATNVEDFLRSRLPMNTSVASGNQNLGTQSVSRSSINLRGLGADQTLILVDGRRQPRSLTLGNLTQADINGIPLSAIERIEVLPSTAGGIYGGGAVGGVINIIRRRNYRGLSLATSYTATTRGGGESGRVDVVGGLVIENGNTQISFSGSYFDSSPLRVRQRDFARRARALQSSNDTASYSTPIAGYTTNIASASGENLTLDDGTSLGSSYTHVPAGYAGPASDDGAALVGAAGRFNFDLPNNASADGSKAMLLGSNRAVSTNVNIRRGFGDKVDAFVDFTYSASKNRSLFGPTLPVTMPASAPGNPFQQDVTLNVPIPDLDKPVKASEEVLAGTVGLIARLGGKWTATAEYGLSRSRNESSYSSSFFNYLALVSAVSSGTIDVFRDTNIYPINVTDIDVPHPTTKIGPYDNVQYIFSGRVGGDILELPGGDVMVTALLERRKEEAGLGYFRGLTNWTIHAERSQAANSGYVELRVPVVSARNRLSLVHDLELQASLRHDRYSTSFAIPSFVNRPPSSRTALPDWNYDTQRVSSTDYTVGVRWGILRDLTLRGSYGSGFLPPSISQLAPTTNIITGGTIYLDPQRGDRPLGSEVPFEAVVGGNPNLKPERSESLSVGFIFTPTFLPNFRLSADYTRIEKTNEIGQISPVLVLQNPQLFPDRVVRGPNPPGDPAGWPGPVQSLDYSLVNLAATRIQAIDFQVNYDLDTQAHGRFQLFGVATWSLERWTRLLPNDLGYDGVGFFGSELSPLEWRGNAGIQWTKGPWEVAWNAQYYDGHSVRYADPALKATSDLFVLLQGSMRIPSQTYHDLSISYQFESGAERHPVLSDLEVRLGIQNVFDKSPPIVAADERGYSTFGDPRMRRVTLTLRKSFGH